MRYLTWYQSAEEKYSPRVCPATPPPSSAAASFCAAATILTSPCLATVHALPRPAFASRRAVARSLRRRRVPAVVLPGGPCEPRAPFLRLRRVPATPPPSSAVAALPLPCLAVALPGHRAHPTDSAVASRLALSFRLTSRCFALPPRPGSSCPACCHPAAAAALPIAIALPGGRPARSQLGRRPAVGIILLLPCPPGRPAIAAPRCLATGALSCYG